jgi:putative phage-type endonuclease
MLEIVQGSPEWHALRCGKVTASRIADIVAKTKTGPSALRANYMAELIAERLTGVPAEGFKSEAMKWGTDKEPEARAAYEFYRSETVKEVGFVLHPTIDQSGASPDGLVGDDGMVEIKCPNSATHLETLLGRMVPAKYVNQMQWQMACAGRQWCDFVSFDPRLPEHMRLFVKRMPRDDQRIKELETEVAGFLLEIAVKLSELNSLFGEREAA